MALNDENPKLQWGILSTANIGKQLVSAFHASPFAAAVVVSSRDPERARQWAAQEGVPRSCGSYDEVLADAEVRAVYIPLPTALHCEWTLKAAAAGKHVLCEKPLAASFGEAAEMARACSAAGVALMDGVFWSHQPKFAAIKRDGHFASLGAVTHCTAHFSWPQRDPGNIRCLPALEPTGCLGDLGWYAIRACLYAFGGELPLRVSGGGSRDEATGAYFEMHALLVYPGGRYATLGCSFAACEHQVFEVHGAEGTLRCQDFVWAHSREACGRYEILRGGGVVERHDVDPGPEPFRPLQLVNRFSQAALEGGALEQWTVLALKTQAIHDAILKSALQDSATVSMDEYVQQYPAIASAIDII